MSAQTRVGIETLKSTIIQTASPEKEEPTLLGDLVNPGDTVILVVPIDRSAPKGRLILPQVQAIRDLLDHHAQALTVQDSYGVTIAYLHGILAGVLSPFPDTLQMLRTACQSFLSYDILKSSMRSLLRKA